VGKLIIFIFYNVGGKSIIKELQIIFKKIKLHTAGKALLVPECTQMMEMFVGS
jgi:hypothetical protein